MDEWLKGHMNVSKFSWKAHGRALTSDLYFDLEE